MSEQQQVKVYYADKGGPAAFAGRLLAAAAELGEDASVVVFGTDGFFTVPEEVADKAGVDFEHDGDRPVEDLEEAVGADPSASEAQGDPEGQSEDDEAQGDGSDDEDDSDSEGDDPKGDGGEVEVVVPQEGEEGYLAGKSLEAALKERGLPSKGKADEKRYAVAAYDASKE